jgi:peptidase M28-like protein
MMFLCLRMTMRQLIPWCFRSLGFAVFAAFAALGLQLACQKQVSPPTLPPTFDQKHSYTLLKDLCNLGPRDHGSETKLKAEKWIQDKLREAGAEVSVHEFTYAGKNATSSESFRNILGRFRPTEQRRVLIGTHYDTRSWADRDPRRELRAAPIVGANDGASGVAVMLEMARAWKERPPPVGVDLFFFDGEEFGREGVFRDYLVGSKAWVRDHPEYKPEWGVVLDMVGDSSLRILKEKSSAARACKAVRRLWEAAERVGSSAFVDGFTGNLYDDHSAFIGRGIPIALVIDYDYPWYHTMEDLPDKCSAESLGQVGRAVMEAVNSDLPGSR